MNEPFGSRSIYQIVVLRTNALSVNGYILGEHLLVPGDFPHRERLGCFGDEGLDDALDEGCERVGDDMPYLVNEGVPLVLHGEERRADREDDAPVFVLAGDGGLVLVVVGVPDDVQMGDPSGEEMRDVLDRIVDFGLDGLRETVIFEGMQTHGQSLTPRLSQVNPGSNRGDGANKIQLMPCVNRRSDAHLSRLGNSI